MSTSNVKYQHRILAEMELHTKKALVTPTWLHEFFHALIVRKLMVWVNDFVGLGGQLTVSP